MISLTSEGEIEETELEKWMNKHKFNEKIKKCIIDNELTIELLETIELEDLKGISKEWNLNFTEKSKFIGAVKLLPNAISKKEIKKIIILDEKTQLLINQLNNQLNYCNLSIQNNKNITQSLLNYFIYFIF